MRYLVLSAALIWAASIVQALELEDHARFGADDAPQLVRIISNADISFFEPVITSYVEENPDTQVDYSVVSSAMLNAEISAGSGAFDIAISSAMDLQTKLANDGLAQSYVSATTQNLPDWAVWNDMVFAFTQEPAAIVLSKKAFADLPLPADRHELISLMRQYPDRFQGKVGTYDIRRSGLGYLFATQDTRASETYWRLTEVFGRLGARLYCCSSDMIRAIRSGELAVAYNVLGSYAANQAGDDQTVIVLPSDFTTIMLRTALIPANAPSPKLAGGFIEHLLQRSFGPDAQFIARDGWRPDQTSSALNRIRLGPGLLVYLDQLKKSAFSAEWEKAILQN